MSAPKCELCKKKTATVHYTEIADSQVSKLFICRDCAESKGLLDEPPPEFEGVEELMSKISKPPGESEAPASLECPACGLTFEEFQKLGKLGCPSCYDAFSERLSPLLRRIHQGERHTGKGTQPASAESATRLAELKKQLDTAVAAEDSERAARLRDEIHVLEAPTPGSTSRARDRAAQDEAATGGEADSDAAPHESQDGGNPDGGSTNGDDTGSADPKGT